MQKSQCSHPPREFGGHGATLVVLGPVVYPGALGSGFPAKGTRRWRWGGRQGEGNCRSRVVESFSIKRGEAPHGLNITGYLPFYSHSSN